MSSSNPYQAPLTADLASEGRRLFPEMSSRDLKRLRDASHTIRALGVLWILGIVFSLFVLSALLASRSLSTAFGISFALVALQMTIGMAAAWGALRRPAWGRGVGIVMCVLILLSFPVGTLLGVLGLIAYSRARPLFGPEARRHHDLNTEWKYRKRHKIG